MLSRSERDVLRVDGALVAGLAGVLHVTTDEILGLEDAESGRPVSPSAAFVRGIQDIERLPRRKKEILLSAIDSFLRGATATR